MSNTVKDTVDALMPHASPKSVLDGKLAALEAIAADIAAGKAAVAENEKRYAAFAEGIVEDLFLDMDWVFTSSSHYSTTIATYETRDPRYDTLEDVLRAAKPPWIRVGSRRRVELTLAKLPPAVAVVAKPGLVNLRNETQKRLKEAEDIVKAKAAEVLDLREILARLT